MVFKNFNLRSFVNVSFVLFFGAMEASGIIVIDNNKTDIFQVVPAGGVPVTIVGPFNYPATSGPDVDGIIIGGSVTVTTVRTAGLGSVSYASGFIAGDVAAFSSASPATVGIVNLLYDAAGGGLGGFDLTEAGSNDRFSGLFGADLVGGTFKVDLTTTTGALTATIPIPANGITLAPFDIPFSAFAGPGTFSSVGSVAATITGPAGLDTVHQLLVTNNVTGIPEPSSMAMGGLSLLVFGGISYSRIRRRNKV